MSAFLIIASLALSPFWAKLPQKTSEDLRLETKRRFESLAVPLAEKSSKKEAEAIAFMKQGRFEAAEAACQEAIEMLASIPFMQNGPRSTLAHVYMAQGLYAEALKLWEPMYVGRGNNMDRGCAMAIAYVRVGKPEKGLQMLKDIHTGGAVLTFATYADLPVATSSTPAAVEATALLLLGSKFTKADEVDEMQARFERAVDLAPQSAPINFALAHFYRSKRGSLERAVPFYKAAYRFGTRPLRERIERGLGDQPKVLAEVQKG